MNTVTFVFAYICSSQKVYRSPLLASLLAQMIKNLPAMQQTQVRPLEKGTATHSGILAWRIPWTEEHGGLQLMGSQRVGGDRVTNTFTLFALSGKIPGLNPGFSLNRFCTGRHTLYLFRVFLWKESYDQPRWHIEKQRHYFANKGLSCQGYGFSCGHVWM